MVQYVPASATFVHAEGGSAAFYSDYVWVSGSGETKIKNWSTTKGLAKAGDILAISAYVWNGSDYYGNYQGSQIAKNREYLSDGIKWAAFGKPGYAKLLKIENNTAYFKCLSNDYCWAEEVVTFQHSVETQPSRGYVMTSYIISGEASKTEQAATKELEQIKALEGQDKTGKTQQNGLNNAAFTQKGTSLVSALTQVANAPASNCRVAAPVHGGNFSFNFCEASRPSWLRPLISIPVAVTSLMLSIHIIKTTAREIERFKAGI